MKWNLYYSKPHFGTATGVYKTPSELLGERVPIFLHYRIKMQVWFMRDIYGR